jgi:hypothetical protein
MEKAAIPGEGGSRGSTLWTDRGRTDHKEQCVAEGRVLEIAGDGPGRDLTGKGGLEHGQTRGSRILRDRIAEHGDILTSFEGVSLGPQLTRRRLTRAQAGTRIPRRQGHLLDAVVQHRFEEFPHRLEHEMVEVRTKTFPKQTPAPGFLEVCLEQRAAMLLGLIHQKRQHHEHGENDREVLLSVSISCAQSDTPGS